MNDIITPVTEDGQVGWDQYGQFWTVWTEGNHIHGMPIADVRFKVCIICNQRWELNGPSLRDQFRWEMLGSYVHESCLIRYLSIDDRNRFYNALVSARIRFDGLEPIDNQYWPGSDPWSKRPWYRAQLLGFPAAFVLGRRKRVTEVRLEPVGQPENFTWHERAQEIFKNEDVTKHFTPRVVMLHAWSEGKVLEYVKKLTIAAGYW